jgi:alpha-D-xyloside xylohydrolase
MIHFLLLLPILIAPGGVATYATTGRSVIVTTTDGGRLRLTPYGDFMIRVQAAGANEEFFPDSRYEMVESHTWEGKFLEREDPGALSFTTRVENGLTIRVAKADARLSFTVRGNAQSLLSTAEGIFRESDGVRIRFAPDSSEHFTGLGHGFFGRADRIEITGDSIGRNYGSEHGEQAPLIVPFYLSSKGYGIFVNSTFPNSFSFNHHGVYEFALRGDAQMDFFFILGPGFREILDRYTQLTGRPRLPPRAMFGLALSDKGNDHTSAAPSDETWWKTKVTEHRMAGFPIDHLVNDNRWRACGGTRCASCLAWDRARFPDPAEYQRWIRAHGLVVTLDFNRCIAKNSEGWLPSYNIPSGAGIDFGDSAPDFTRNEVRSWFWNLFWNKTLNPALHYPGDALWIDEFDEMGKAPLSMVLGNGRTWGEMKNYWFFLIAKSLVQEGWDRFLAPGKRPFVWVRGMTAGGQRYATLWSGDIRPSYDEMKSQVRGMQLAGLAGFPFWGHDAGGFHDWQTGRGPDDVMYRQWSMAFGSFSPFWKPHGMGASRWPLDRTPEARRDAKVYCDLRYGLMPYLYTCAREASIHGLPIARAMVIDYPTEPRAWRYDLQYMWGEDFLVAPDCSPGGEVGLWLPPGMWYDFWNDSLHTGDNELRVEAPTGRIPLFVRAGAIIPATRPAHSTAYLPNDSLTIHAYAGADGQFTLYEDDGVSELYTSQHRFRTTRMTFRQQPLRLAIEASHGTYEGAPASRAYTVQIHGLSHPVPLTLNGSALKNVAGAPGPDHASPVMAWDASRRVLSVTVPGNPVREGITLAEIPPSTRYVQTGATTTVYSGDSAVRFRLYARDILRVDELPRGDAPEESSLVVIRNPSSAAFTVREDDSTISLTSSNLRIRCTRVPLRISVLDSAGNPLLHEPVSGGVVRDGIRRGARFSINPGWHFYGTGERGTPVDKRGQAFQSFNTQIGGYSTPLPTMNLNVPFLASSAGFALYFENTYEGRFDIGSADSSVLSYETSGGTMSYFLIAAPTVPLQLDRYTWLTGRQPLPPRWAFGYIQSKNRYADDSTARAIVRTMRQKRIPCDAIVLDLKWFKEMGDLSWNSESWPSPDSMMSDFLSQGIKTILITEPYMVDRSRNFPEAVRAGYLARDSSGKPFVMDNWWSCNGCRAGLIDITNPEARRWWWSLHPPFMGAHVAGLWTDLGEPERHPPGMMHWLGTAAKVHNIYNLLWAKTVFEGMREMCPDARVFNLTRSGYAGIQRYGVIPWSGDVSRSFGGLAIQIPMLLSAGLSGLAYHNSDIGGYARTPTSPELYIRWMQYGTFCPIARAHGAGEGTRGSPTEPWMFGPEAERICREFISLRYRLLPYLYTLAWQNWSSGIPLARPLFFLDPTDPRLADEGGSYMLGDALLVSPVVEPSQREKRVYLPNGEWIDFWTDSLYRGGSNVTVPAPLERMPIFVKGGSIVPLAPLMAYSDERPLDTLALAIYPGTQSYGSFTLYEDDGKTLAYQQGSFALSTYRLLPPDSPGTRSLNIILEPSRGSYAGKPEQRTYRLEIHGVMKVPVQVTLNGVPVSMRDFHVDPSTHILSLSLPAPNAAPLNLVIKSTN